MAKGPLTGVKVLEFGGIGPGPFAGMMLSDMGADVVEIARKGAPPPPAYRPDARGRRRITLDLKTPEAVETCLRLAEKADITFEGNRPGVMERLGLGPDVMLARNPALVYGRMTGWGQFGPYAHTAGHDINYLALTGALHAIGPADRPVAPLNIAADYGGGAMFLVTGILAALLHARATGQGQVVDAGMTDGASYLMSLFYGLHAGGKWQDKREANLLDGAAPFYGTFQCSDGKWVSIGSIEPQFYALLLEKTGAGDTLTQPQMSFKDWPQMRQALRDIFITRTRDEWCAVMEGTDVCFAPVLSLAEAPKHPHNVARETFVESAGVVQPAPAPRFSRTPGAIQWPPSPDIYEAEDVIASWG
ncbi:CoA transferase [Niveispirillum sp. SYP-B3756]|uniref:CaiB/BaiF CoA transferase family protein n=1 Tax=Niveispirillum sp. SYP-B3756 TaxID=2662178 RepID=UPI0012927DCC|nr:CaiB/BaiF CoA-transferase family protein [Niveispirillum sp. SYP-B3756]MQP68332.1 CoA transferase [Niveispirillum sp. SYP-B3756]